MGKLKIDKSSLHCKTVVENDKEEVQHVWKPLGNKGAVETTMRPWTILYLLSIWWVVTL